jgi:hypothetical protein
MFGTFPGMPFPNQQPSWLTTGAAQPLRFGMFSTTIPTSPMEQSPSPTSSTAGRKRPREVLRSTTKKRKIPADPWLDEHYPFLVPEGERVLPWLWNGSQMEQIFAGGPKNESLLAYFDKVDEVVPEQDFTDSMTKAAVFQRISKYLPTGLRGNRIFSVNPHSCGHVAQWKNGIWSSQSEELCGHLKQTSIGKYRPEAAKALSILVLRVPKEAGGGFEFPFFTNGRWHVFETV